MQLIGGVGDRNHNALGHAKSTLAGIQDKNFTKIEAHAGMAERTVIDLAIVENIQIKIKLHYQTTINHMCNVVLYHTRKQLKQVKNHHYI